MLGSSSCENFPRVESLFPPCTQALLAFKSKCSEGSLSQCQTLKLGNLTWSSGLSLVGETLIKLFSSLWVTTQQVWDLILLQKCPFYHLLVASSLSLDINIFSVCSSLLLCSSLLSVCAGHYLFDIWCADIAALLHFRMVGTNLVPAQGSLSSGGSTLPWSSCK